MISRMTEVVSPVGPKFTPDSSNPMSESTCDQPDASGNSCSNGPKLVSVSESAAELDGKMVEAPLENGCKSDALMVGNRNMNTLEEMRDMMSTLAANLQILTSEIRLLRLTRLPGISSDEDESGLVHEFKNEDRLPKTPKKVTPVEQEMMRRDLSPLSSLSPEPPSSVEIKRELILATNPLRRSLVFPKSLEEQLDRPVEKKQIDRGICEHIFAGMRKQCVPGVCQDHGEAPKTNIKLDRLEDQCERKPSLLMLADVALRCSPGIQPGLYPDSGLSTGDSSSGSPISYWRDGKPYDKVSTAVHRLTKKRKSSDANLQAKKRIILPASPNSYSSQEGDETEVGASGASKLNTRKRRKTKQPLPCSYCGKLFNNQSSLRQHESFHRPLRPFKCEHSHCDKAYKTRSELNRHLVVHSGEKKHLCKLCGKKFLRKQYLKTHLLRHHETGITMVAPPTNRDKGSTVATSNFVNRPEPLTWKCDICFKIFVNNEDLNRHRRSYHEKKRPASLKFSAVSADAKNGAAAEPAERVSHNSVLEEETSETAKLKVKNTQIKMQLVDH